MSSESESVGRIVLTYQDIERICEWFRFAEGVCGEVSVDIEAEDRALYNRIRGAKVATT